MNKYSMEIIWKILRKYLLLDLIIKLGHKLFSFIISIADEHFAPFKRKENMQMLHQSFPSCMHAVE